MRFKFLGYVMALTVGLALAQVVSAQPKNRKASDSGGDKTIDKQMEWEKKVMGDDHAKAADMKKIAAAQKLADDAAKNPKPAPPPKVKDPNKEGVRAKQEAAIGLPIASDKENQPTKKSSGAKKTAAASSSTNDELGALVATSLAEEKSNDAAPSHSKGNRTKGGNGNSSKGHASSSTPSSLDQMFAASSGGK